MSTNLLAISWPFGFFEDPVLDAFVSIFIIAGALINVVAVYAGLCTLVERKIAGHMQSRVGPYRVGPHGFLQWAADAVKLMLKEDIIAKGTDKFLFRLSPYLVMAGAFACWVALPYAPGWQPASMNIGLLYLLAVSSAVVIGILMAGWASGNKWALFGAMRSAAQIVSYEVPVGLTLLAMLFIYGTLDMQEICRAQQTGLPFGLEALGSGEGPVYGGIYSWGVFRYAPFTVIAFVIYYIGALAETNRTPFDIPEAESELVAGYHTEYSGMRFSFFFLAEYANMFVVSAIATTIFLGGWAPLVPSINSYVLAFLPAALLGAILGFGRSRSVFNALVGAGIGGAIGIAVAVWKLPPAAGEEFTGAVPPQFLGGILWFSLKCFTLLFIMMWLRWTLPRYRVDQLMDLCWKKLTPVAMANLLIIALLETRASWWAAIFGGGS